MRNQENDSENVFLLNLQNKLVRCLKKSVWWNKEQLKRNQLLQAYLNQLKIWKEYKVSLLDEG